MYPLKGLAQALGLGKLSAGLNFFIPIIDGLEWLNVKVKAP